MVIPPHDETFLPTVSLPRKVDGATSRPSIFSSFHIVKHTRGLKLILIKEVPWIFTWRPQCAIRRIGASDPPLYSCKKLERSLKSNGAIFLILTQIWRKQFPPSSHTHTEAYLHGTNWVLKVCEKTVKSPKSPCVKAAPGLRSVNAESSPDPESKSGPKWPGSGSGVWIRVRRLDPANNDLDPDSFFLFLWFFF